ncbi:MAG: thioredoxin domain-containing protein [Bacteriovoracia bacterium]
MALKLERFSMANRLRFETSPYLQQHSENPVDWYPWGDEALQKAKEENKPILLSIGYSACHWCHVMEAECFESEEIAKIMNDHFVNIKVDKEERPDLDQVYQNVAQLMMRGGGWPLTVFLTPDLKPFFGGTYFPPEDRYGRPGFPKVLLSLSKAFENDRLEVNAQAEKFRSAIEQLESVSDLENELPNISDLKNIAQDLLDYFDWKNGGFGSAPKFPNTGCLSFLWRIGNATGMEVAKEAVILSLEKMAKGGIYDQLGGGFHRYSVDENWTVPHFEKMLYDNALLLKLYAEVLTSQETRNPLFEEVLIETFEYLQREMRSNEGLFYSAQDADSESEEGAFFVWTQDQILSALGESDGKHFCQAMGVTREGNFEDTNKNVLTRVEQKPSSYKKLFSEREKREKPFRDEKSLLSWNALTLSALVWCVKSFSDAKKREEAQRIAEDLFESICSKFKDEEHLFLSVYKDGKAKIPAFLDDLAFLALASAELSTVSQKLSKAALSLSEEILEKIISDFSDDRDGFYFNGKKHEKLIVRPKTLYDQAIPSGTAITCEALLVLSEILPRPQFYERATSLVAKSYPQLKRAPMGMGELACASLLYVMGPVVVGKNSIVHPHVFKRQDYSSEQICHHQTCRQVNENEFKKIIQEVLHSQ